MQTRRALLLAASLFAVAGCESIDTTDPSSETQDGTPEDAQTGTETSVTRKDPAAKIHVSNQIRQQLLAGNDVELIVEFEDAGLRNKGAQDIQSITQRNISLRDAVMNHVRNFKVQLTREYSMLPMMVVRANNVRALDALANSEVVTNIFENIKMRPATAESLGANPGGINYASPASTDGNTSYVAVVDTGLDYDNSIFGTCDDSAVERGTGAITGCSVVGVTQSLAGTDASKDDNQTDSDGNTTAAGGHGTLTAGIIKTIAPGVKLWGYDVYPKDNNNTTTVDEADETNAANILVALNDIISKDTAGTVDFDVVVIGAVEATNTQQNPPTSGNCDGSSFNTALGTLVTTRGITVVVPAGNDGSNTGLRAPACDSRVISVGATWDAAGSAGTYGGCTDTPAAGAATCFTNASSALTLFAPGGLTTLALGSATPTNQVGTSIAAAHAAGAAAVLRTTYSTETPAFIKKRMVESATTNVTRTQTGTTAVTKPLLNLTAAASSTLCVATVSSGSPATLDAELGSDANVTLSGVSGCNGTAPSISGLPSWLSSNAASVSFASGSATVTLTTTEKNATKSNRTGSSPVVIANNNVTVTQSGDGDAPTVTGLSVALASGQPTIKTNGTGTLAGRQYVEDDDWNLTVTVSSAATDAVSGTTLKYCIKTGSGDGTGTDNSSCINSQSLSWPPAGGVAAIPVPGKQSDGQRYASLWIGDEANNGAKVGTVSYYVDTLQPVVPTPTATDANASVSLSFSATDANGVIQYDIYRTAQVSGVDAPTCSTVSGQPITSLYNEYAEGNVTVGTVGSSMDGATLAVSDVNGTTVTFELDGNSSSTVGNTAVSFTPADTNDTWALTVSAAALNGDTFVVAGTTYRMTDYFSDHAGQAGTFVQFVQNGVNANADLNVTSLPADGDTVTLNDVNGSLDFVFEFDSNGAVTLGNLDVNITGLSTTTEIAQALVNEIDANGTYGAVHYSNGFVRVSHPTDGNMGDVTISRSTNINTWPSTNHAGAGADNTTAIAAAIAAKVGAIASASSNVVTFTSATAGAGGRLGVSENSANMTVTNPVVGVTQSTSAEVAETLTTAINAASNLNTTATRSGALITLRADVPGDTADLTATGTGLTLSGIMDNGNAIAGTYTDSNVTVTTSGLGYWYTVCATDNTGKESVGASALGRPRTDRTAPTVSVIDVTQVSGVSVTPGTTTGVAQLALQGYCTDNNGTDECYTNDTNVTLQLRGISETGSLFSCYGNTSTACTSSVGPWNSLTVDSNGTANLTITVSGTALRDYFVFVADAAYNVASAKAIKIQYETQAPPNPRLTLAAGVLSTTASWAISRDTASGNWLHKVVRSTSPTEPTVKCTADTEVETDTNTTSPSAADSGLTAGTTYIYRVCHRDRAGNWSDGATASILARPEINGPTPKSGTRQEIQTGGTCTGLTAKTACENAQCYWERLTATTGTCRENLVMIGRIGSAGAYEGGDWTKKTNPRVFVEADENSTKATSGAPQTFRNLNTTTDVALGASGMTVCFSASSLLYKNCSQYRTYESVLDTSGTGAEVALLNGDGSRYVGAWVRDVWGNPSDSDNNVTNGYQPYRDEINVDRTAPTATGAVTATLSGGTVTITGAVQTDSLGMAGFNRGGVTYKAYFAKNSAPNASICRNGTAAVTACTPTESGGSVSCTWTPSPAPAAGTKYGFRICAADGVDNWSAGVGTTSVVTF